MNLSLNLSSVCVFRGETIVLQTVLGLDLRLLRLILVAVLLRF